MTTGVSVQIGADNSGLTDAVTDSKKKLAELQKEMRGAVSDAAKFGAAATLAGAAIVAGLVKSGMDAVVAQSALVKELNASLRGLKSLEGAAGDVGISYESVVASAQKLNLTIEQARQGNAAASDAFKRLGLDAEQLAKMDVDKKMAAIADRVKALGLSAGETTSALRDMGIRQSEMTNLMMQGGDAIRDEAKVVDQLGTALNAVDAKKVVLASQAMGVFDDLLQGAAAHAATEFAPIITAITTLLEDTAKEAGGMGSAVSSVFDKIVSAAAFAMDAADGVKRVFTLMGDSVIIQFSYIAQRTAETFATILSYVDSIPGIDVTAAVASIDEFAKTSKSIVSEAANNMKETLDRPLSGEKFKQYVADAKIAAQQAAEAAVEADKNIQGRQSEGLGESPEQKTAREALEEKVKDAKEAQDKITADQNKAIVDRVEAIRQGNLSDTEALAEKYAADNALLVAAKDAKLITEESYNSIFLETASTYNQALSDIEKKESDKRIQQAQVEAENKKRILGGALNAMTGLMNSGSRKLFEIGKAAAISQSIIATYSGMTEALKLGWPLGPIAAGAIGLAGFANVQSIRSQAFGSSGGSAGSVTQQVSANTSTVDNGNQGSQGQSNTYHFEGLSAGSVVSSDSVVAALKQAQKDGALRGNVTFAA